MPRGQLIRKYLIVEEARSFSTSPNLTETIAEVETRLLNQDRPQESVVRETVSPVRDSASMEIDPEVGSSLSRQRTALSKPTFADMVADRKKVYSHRGSGFA